MSSSDVTASRFSGFCFDYDRYRPKPPDELMELAEGWSGPGALGLVVDLGCGTGLSTRPWAHRSRQVVGIDPSDDMLEAARRATADGNIRFAKGSGEATGLADGVADVVTCSSAVHWMEPGPTVQEIMRILRQGGVLLVYGHYYPVFVSSPSLTAFYERWRKNLDQLEYGIEQQAAQKWPLSDLYQAVDAHPEHGYTRRHYVHSRLTWSPAQVEGFFRAHAGVPFLVQRGYSEEDLLIPELMALLTREQRADTFDIQLTYSVFLMIKGTN